jgi:hypothetical protein
VVASASDTISLTGNGKVSLSPMASGTYQGLCCEKTVPGKFLAFDPVSCNLGR